MPDISFLRPLRHTSFAVMWTAAVVTDMGDWMQSAAAGWLMTTLNADPRTVVLVQVATVLPMFLLGPLAGVLADIVDRRRLMLVVESLMMIFIAVLAFLVGQQRIGAASLLVFTFVLNAGSALVSPTWQAIVPQLVPAADLSPAITLNSTGINISRAVGPALAGVIITSWGMSAPFWINAVSGIGALAALLWWRGGSGHKSSLPAERFGSAMLTGLRHARYNSRLGATLVRATGFFVFASAYWALLPLIAKNQIAGGPGAYGLLLGFIGAGAVVGASALPRFKARLSPHALINIGTIGSAVALLLYAQARDLWIGVLASFLAGTSWIAVVATLNVSAQMALPAWVRGRGSAVFVTVMFGSMAAGSLIWGQLAASRDVATAIYVAAGGALIMIPVLRRWQVQSSADLDLSPAMHWPEPVATQRLADDRGPVLVTLEYRIAENNKRQFLKAMRGIAAERKRDGAYRWGIFEDVAVAGRWLEIFLVDSWIEHQRQHRRVTVADKLVERELVRFHAAGEPTVTHYVGPASEDGRFT